MKLRKSAAMMLCINAVFFGNYALADNLQEPVDSAQATVNAVQDNTNLSQNAAVSTPNVSDSQSSAATVSSDVQSNLPVISPSQTSMSGGQANPSTSVQPSVTPVSTPAAAVIKPLVVKSGQKIVKVTLKGNVTTGYQWYVAKYNHQLLTLNGYSYVAPNNGLMGAPGQAIFKFTVNPAFVAAPQLTKIDFISARNWDLSTATHKAVWVVSAPTMTHNKPTAIPDPNDNWMILPSS